jgi:hypothetical protein
VVGTIIGNYAQTFFKLKKLTMKKLLIAGALLMSVAAIQASKQTGKTGLAFAQSNWNAVRDTVPQDTTDTTNKPQFYGSVAWSNINDTVPQDTSDTTNKPQFFGSVAWNNINDTVPQDTSDTTHKPQLYAVR